MPGSKKRGKARAESREVPAGRVVSLLDGLDDDDLLRTFLKMCHPLELTTLFVTCKRIRNLMLSSGRVAYLSTYKKEPVVICVKYQPAASPSLVDRFHIEMYKRDNATDRSGYERAITSISSHMCKVKTNPGAPIEFLEKVKAVMDSPDVRDHIRAKAIGIMHEVAKGPVDLSGPSSLEKEILGITLTNAQIRRIRTMKLTHKEECTPESTTTMTRNQIELVKKGKSPGVTIPSSIKFVMRKMKKLPC